MAKKKKKKLEDMRTCKKGWIISLDENFEYVPFFIYVRDKDIWWDIDQTLEKTLYNIDQKYFKNNPPNITGPTGRASFFRHGWKVTIHTDLSFEISKEICLQDVFNVGYDNSHQLRGRIYLPLMMERENIDINVTCNAKNDLVRSSIVSIELEDKEYIDIVDIYLINKHDNFPENFSEDESFMKSSLFLTFHGRLKIED